MQSLAYLSLHMYFIINVLRITSIQDSSTLLDVLVVILLLTICVMLSWVRKLWKLAFNYIIGNLITFGLIACLFYVKFHHLDTNTRIVTDFNSGTSDIIEGLKSLGIGLASFEGIVLVLPIRQHLRQKE